MLPLNVALLIMTPLVTGCPRDQAAACLRNLLRMANQQMPTCETVDLLEHCHRFEGCSEQMLAEISSTQYLSLYGRMIPPDVFVSLRKALRDKCRVRLMQCDAYPEARCKAQLTRADQEREEAMYFELEGQIRQYELNMRPRMEGCRTARTTLGKWLYARQEKCGPLSAICLCSAYKKRLDPFRCFVNCPSDGGALALKVSRGGLQMNGDTRFTALTLWVLSVVATQFLSRLLTM